ncbi:MAG: helix-turn-helix domain-containing protein [Verrucomicrobia bacterium]|nr:MAG: helix-turn-helix domain-containing protein [Verrucomicrobiota bacterium]
MKSSSFDNLAKLAVVKEYGAAFRKATGVSLIIVPADQPHQPFGREQNLFCGLIFQTPGGCRACSQTERQVLRQAAQKETAQQFHCFAGLTVVAVPVMVAGRHSATLVSGQVLRREPSPRDFALISKMLGDGLNASVVKKVRQAYFAIPVVTAERFQSIVKLLTLFAQQLGEIASRQALATAAVEPQPVVLAKEFLKSHADQDPTLAEVAQQAHVSSFYLCKLFKKTTGMTFTEYLARLRVEKAKTLLLNPMARVSEVVFAAGFGSIPQFNSLFKRYVGMPPRQYRHTMHTRLNP